MSEKRLEFLRLFTKGKIDFKTYNRILYYLDMIGE